MSSHRRPPGEVLPCRNFGTARATQPNRVPVPFSGAVARVDALLGTLAETTRGLGSCDGAGLQLAIAGRLRLGAPGVRVGHAPARRNEPQDGGPTPDRRRAP